MKTGPMKIKDFASLLCCPDCRSDLKFFVLDENEEGESGLMECSACENVFPFKDGIPILLRTGTRNTAFELAIFEKLKSKSTDPEVSKKLNSATTKLGKIKFTGSWEWDDVDFWDKIYEENWLKLKSGDPSFYEKKLAERILQRKNEFEILKKDGLAGDLILEVGAGTATYTEDILNTYSENKYVAVDMSFYGLKVRRELLKRKNALYILASIDNLPIKKNSVACMILIGILHHSEHKEHTLPSLLNLLCERGLLYLDEVLYRPSFLNHSHLTRGENVSLHEEYCYKEPLLWHLKQQGTILYCKIFNTPFYNLAIKKFLKFVTYNEISYSLIRFLDTCCRKTIGLLLPSCKEGEIAVIWQKGAQDKPLDE